MNTGVRPHLPASGAGPRWERSGPNYRQWSPATGERWQHAVKCANCGKLKRWDQNEAGLLPMESGPVHR